MNRAEVLQARRKRRRVVLTVAFTLALGVLVTAGVGLGAAVGAAAAQVRLIVPKIFPPETPSLPANKVAPPKPVDVSGPAVACAASSLTLTAQPNRAAMNPGEAVGVKVTATNSGRYPCLLNGGMGNVRLRLENVTGDGAWAAADCGLEGSRELMIGPGQQVSWDLIWDGHASAPGVCGDWQPVVQPGPWRFVASLAEVAHSDSAPYAIVINGAVEPEPQYIPDVVPEIVPEVAVPDVVLPDAGAVTDVAELPDAVATPDAG